ncbi:MAG: DNA polymerase III subunit beta [Pseudomonadota bacterium]
MEFQTKRSALLKPLQAVVGVVEKRQTLPILGNLLLSAQGDTLQLTGTDLELEMQSTLTVTVNKPGTSTIPARKFFDICRSLPEDAEIQVSIDGDKGVVRSGRSRFTLQSLPAADFPAMDRKGEKLSGRIEQQALKFALDRTAMAMAQQDVRYYLNGLLLECHPERIRCVATDGHRLALAEADAASNAAQPLQVIVPRKGVLELQRLLENNDEEVQFAIGDNFLRVSRSDLVFTSKLVDGRFPDYERVIPRTHDQQLVVEREALRGALQRVAILSSEKFRAARLHLLPDQLCVSAHNVEQEEAEEYLAAQYQGAEMEIGFNIHYLIDAVNSLSDTMVQILLKDPSSSGLVRALDKEQPLYVVMPMRL